MPLLQHTFSENGNSASIKWQGGPHARGTVMVDPADNDFGSGTLTLQYCEDDANWSSDTGVQLAGDDKTFKTFQLPPGYLRLSLGGSTSPDLKASILAH